MQFEIRKEPLLGVTRAGAPGQYLGPRKVEFGSTIGGQKAGGEHSTRHLILSLYTELPQGNITIEEFESLALDRLRVLKGIEDFKLRNKTEAEVQARARELLQKHLDGSCNEETARRDQLSHYILRLAHCRTPDLRKWLLTQECELFRLRFTELMEHKDDKIAFLSRSGLSYQPVSSQEVEDLEDDLRAVMSSQAVLGEAQSQEIHQGYFKAPFYTVPDLVAGRKCLVRGGWAYVSSRDLVSLVAQDFREALSKGLADINRRYRDMFPDSDSRLRPLVAGLAHRYLGSNSQLAAAAGSRHGPLSLASLPAAAAKHFPLCMQNLMAQLHAAHHLRHGGRQQLSLFLKTVGLPLEDALVFWRSAFAPVMPADKWDKEHAYNIRHNYGKEGARKDYSAHTCVSLVRMTGGPSDHHGCPYKRMDPAGLRTALARAGCESSKVDEVVTKARSGHFQIACACAFESIHRTQLDVGINHPAEYYSESRRVYEERAAAAGATPQPPLPAAGADAVEVQGAAPQQAEAAPPAAASAELQ